MTRREEETLAGAWELISFDIQRPNTPDWEPWGQPLKGLLIYSQDGCCSVAIHRGEPSSLSLEDMLFYSGEYFVGEDTIVHLVEVASDPGRLGKELVRRFQLDGSFLTLTGANEGGTNFRLRWQRRGAPRAKEIPKMDNAFQDRQPILYEWELDVRFSDMDPYGHLSAPLYLDLIATSRLLYLERKYGLSTADLINKGIGFYLSKSSQEFLRPVVGFTPIRISSFVQTVDGPKLVIPYEMKDAGSGKLFSKGTLEYAVIDTRTKRPTEMPNCLADCFFLPFDSR